MYFDMKSYLKSNNYYTAKHAARFKQQHIKLYIYKHLIYYFNIFLNKNILKNIPCLLL
jgi:hypothetical protein